MSERGERVRVWGRRTQVRSLYLDLHHGVPSGLLVSAIRLFGTLFVSCLQYKRDIGTPDWGAREIFLWLSFRSLCRIYSVHQRLARLQFPSPVQCWCGRRRHFHFLCGECAIFTVLFIFLLLESWADKLLCFVVMHILLQERNTL